VVFVQQTQTDRTIFISRQIINENNIKKIFDIIVIHVVKRFNLVLKSLFRETIIEDITFNFYNKLFFCLLSEGI